MTLIEAIKENNEKAFFEFYSRRTYQAKGLLTKLIR